MQVTNHFNLPEIYHRAAIKQRSAYASGRGKADYSTTQLPQAGLKAFLKRKHHAELSTDIAEMVSSLLGTAVHHVLESGAGPFDLVEERFTRSIETPFGTRTISGQVDHYDVETCALSDHKTTKVYTIQKGEFRNYVAQLNVNAWLMNGNGYHVSRLSNVFILVDWSKTKSGEDGYPAYPIEEIDQPIWSPQQTERYIQARIEALETAAPCTDDERWKKPLVYAVMKNGGVRAVKKFDFEGEAAKFVAAQKEPSDYHIDKRGGNYTYCEHYCDVREFCPMYQEENDICGEETEQEVNPVICQVPAVRTVTIDTTGEEIVEDASMIMRKDGTLEIGPAMTDEQLSDDSDDEDCMFHRGDIVEYTDPAGFVHRVKITMIVRKKSSMIRVLPLDLEDAEETRVPIDSLRIIPPPPPLAPQPMLMDDGSQIPF
jgi:hypothetical protein